jgi:hypothetical protein
MSFNLTEEQRMIRAISPGIMFNPRLPRETGHASFRSKT